jgi:O-antigen/teichoic acid export membrane protein
MGIVFRQSVKSSLVIFFGAFLGVIVIALSTKYLQKQEFGYLRYLTGQAIVISQIAMFGMNNTLAVFVHKYGERIPQKKLLITLCALAPIVITLLLSIPYFLLKAQFLLLFQNQQDVQMLSRFYFLLPLYIVFWSLIMVFEVYLGSQMRVAQSVLMREVVLRLINICLILLLAADILSFHFFIILNIAAHFIPLCLLLYLSRRTEGFGFSLNFKDFSSSDYKSIVHFAWYHLLLGFSINLLGYIDTLMLGSLDKGGMGSVAVYSVAVYIISVIQIPYRAMSTATVPDLTRAYEQQDQQKVSDLFTRAGMNILIVSVGMAIVLVTNLNNIVLLLNKEYESIYWVIIILLLGRLVDMATGMNNEMISISKYYKINFYLTIFLVVMIFAFNRLLIPKIGIYGAAWGTTIALIIFNILKLIFLWKKMRLLPYSGKSVYVVLGGLAAGYIGYIIPFMAHPIVDSVLRSVFILIIFTGFLLYFKPSEDLNKYFTSIRNNKRLF